MRTSSVAVRGLVLAMFGLGAGSALGQNVTAFNPYNGVGLPGGQPPTLARGNRSVSADQAPPSGPAFNPWNPSSVQAGAPTSQGVAAVPRGQVPQASAPSNSYGAPYYDRGSNLPEAPSDALRSRVVALPQKGEPTVAPRGGYAPPAAGSGTPVPLARMEPATPPPAAAATSPAPQPAPLPTPPTAPAVVSTTTPASSPPGAPPSSAPAAPPRSAAVAPPATEPEPPPPAQTPPTSTVLFAMDSAEINDSAKTELDRIAKAANTHGLRQIELRAYAGGADVVDSRKVALARALAVRSYLIDQGVKARIEVGTFGPAAKGMGPSDRVDLVAPGI